MVTDGDRIKRDKIIAIVEPDKVNIELKSISVEVVLEHLYQARDQVSIGAVIDRVETSADTSPSSNADTPGKQTASVSPVALRMAQGQWVDIGSIHRSRVGEKITRNDVQMVERLTAVLNPPMHRGQFLTTSQTELD